MIQQPYDLFKPGWADQYVVGMINQVAQAMDDFITSQVIVYVNRTSLYEQWQFVLSSILPGFFTKKKSCELHIII